jgi:hypothetical protein
MGGTILSNQSVTSSNDEEGGTETDGAMGDGFYAVYSWSAPSWR